MSTETKAKTEIAQRLESWRGDRTQWDLAVKMDTRPQTVSKWEQGSVPRSWMLLRELAREGCDLNWLLTGRPRAQEDE